MDNRSQSQNNGGRVAFGLSLCLALFSPLNAAANTVSFTLAGCEEIRADKISQLLTLEQTLSLAKLPTRSMPRIAITCGPKETTISLQDPLTRKTVMRSIPSPQSQDVGSERTLAIAASELIVASWMELLLPPRENTAQSPELAGAQQTIRNALQARIEPQPTQWSVGVGVGGRARQLARPFWLWRARLRVAREVLPSWRLFGEATAESGRASRTPGHVNALLFGGAVGAAFSLRITQALTFEAEAAFGALYTRLAGEASDASVLATHAEGASGEAMTGVGLAWSSKRLRVALALETGVTFPTVAGGVNGDDEVLLSGIWVGGVGRFALSF
ncbi:MAG: hypothetical protein JRH20_08320 [Deltaproteobacteria bacterium]|nr:hypothetical protein [Deltaproteobacteria bacterium]